MQRDITRDYRTEFDKKPLFKKSLMTMDDLKVGIKVTGAVVNITHFGCFIDIGVGHEALLHSSCMKGMTLNIGDRIESYIINFDKSKKRIGLNLIEIL